MQDLLVKALRLANIADMDAATNLIGCVMCFIAGMNALSGHNWCFSMNASGSS